ncbi:hypothetical protein H257_01645 [Aphanomyces astaci]|uniref:WRKY transcription factor 19 n=1 Tax=Aphanomyces astaci TaxID=112090 RepID=W4H5A2_APHAT|nr:hypothetical protein H257_01645 [Aphanomyces astaci]ETV86449.1 hypothetical protein H257_01645 [Aphanomyces astaci]|eukprot:XP_009823248.1 hypothetical protein H257_01645 [Aphanomyces astaci]
MPLEPKALLPASPLINPPLPTVLVRCGVTTCARFAKRDGLCLGHHYDCSMLPSRRPLQPQPVAPVAVATASTLHAQRSSIVRAAAQRQYAPSLRPSAVENAQIERMISKPHCRTLKDKCCAIADCHKLARIDGFCTKHNMQFASQKRKCVVDACTAYARTRGLCTRHGGGKTCAVHGCKIVLQTGGVCRSHGEGPRCKYVTCVHFTRARGLCSLHRPETEETVEA